MNRTVRDTDGDVVGTGKVANDTIGSSDAHMTDEWKQPGEHGNGCPDEAVWVPNTFWIDAIVGIVWEKAVVVH